MQEMTYRTLVVKRPKWVYLMFPILLAGLVVTITWSKAGLGMSMLYTLLFLAMGFTWFYVTLSLSKRLPAQGKLQVSPQRIELFQYPDHGRYQENSMHQSYDPAKLVRIRHGYFRRDKYHYMLFETIKGKNLAVISYAAIFLNKAEFEKAYGLIRQLTKAKLEQEKND